MQRPIKAYWDLEPQYPHTCLNDGAIVFSASTINIFTDVLTTILPMPLIWKLKLPARQRLAVMGIFGLGIIVDVAGAIRTYYVWKSMIASYDTTWKGWPVLLAATVEINLGLVFTKIPAVFSLSNYHRFVPLLLHYDHWSTFSSPVFLAPHIATVQIADTAREISRTRASRGGSSH